MGICNVGFIFPCPWVNVTEKLLIGKICHIKNIAKKIYTKQKVAQGYFYNYIFSVSYQIKETKSLRTSARFRWP